MTAGSSVNQDDFHRVEKLFQAAADLPPPERAAFLARECHDDAGLRDRVERLLSRLGETLEASGSARHVGPFPAAAITEGPGTIIDRYKLLQAIGEGGFGVVYMAEQQEPVVRKVALKIIKLGMDTREVVARFEAERQALAMMDHPHIAKVLDGGATGSGRPYFVMELVRGVSITEFCDKNDLGTHPRLELFVKVCHAVQHAHQKGVLHRDLKPTNVLVTLNDGSPMPKIIDFGVAKAMHTRLTEKTLFTHYEQFVGTPAYMSPEQAELSALDVDTRTDIYSLGVLLYEILTGTTPFDTAALLKAGIGEVQRVIREEEPPRPSVRVSTTGDAAIAGHRGADVAGLGRLLKGDLDWIVMKALEKDRSRRYDSAGAFADDVRRHLSNEPVTAGPPRPGYRLGKFLARNRAVVVAASLVAVALIVGIIGTTAAMFQATDNAKLANEQADRALAAVDFLLSTLSLTNPEVALNPDVTVLTLLDHTSKGVAEAFEDYPGVEVRVRTTIGRAYARLGQHALAEPHLRRVIEIADAFTLPSGEYDRVLVSAGFDALEFYFALWTLTNVCFNLDLSDSFVVWGRTQGVGLGYLRASHAELAEALRRFSEAVEANAWSHAPDAMKGVPELFDRVEALADAELQDGDPGWPIVSNSFLAAGYAIWYTPHEPRAERYWNEALRIQRRELPPHHPDISTTVNLLVGLLNKQGKHARSELLLRESLRSLRQVHREGSFSIAMAEGMLGQTLTQQGRFAEAEPILLKSHEDLLASVKDESNWMIVGSLVAIVTLYEAWGELENARPFREALARASATSRYAQQWESVRHAFGPGDQVIRELGDRLNTRCGGISYTATPGMKRIEHLLPAIEEFVERSRVVLNAGDPEAAALARVMLGWANVLEPAGHRDARCALAEAAATILDAWQGVLSLDYAESAALLSGCRYASGNVEAARRYGHEAWRALANKTPTGNWLVASQKVRIGRELRALGMFREAEKLLQPAYEVLEIQVGPSHNDTRAARDQLRRLYTEWGRPNEAREYADPVASSLLPETQKSPTNPHFPRETKDSP